jgi:copper(I)-binding protein
MPSFIPRRLAAIVVALLLASDAMGQEARVGMVTVSGAHAFATPPSARTGAAYMTIANTGAAGDRLIAASTPAAGKVELHRMIRDGDVMRMREVAAIDIAAGGHVQLQRGGLHVMLIDLRQPLREGERIALTLTFEKAGAVELTVPIQRQGAARGGHHQH